MRTVSLGSLTPRSSSARQQSAVLWSVPSEEEMMMALKLSSSE